MSDTGKEVASSPEAGMPSHDEASGEQLLMVCDEPYHTPQSRHRCKKPLMHTGRHYCCGLEWGTSSPDVRTTDPETSKLAAEWVGRRDRARLMKDVLATFVRDSNRDPLGLGPSGSPVWVSGLTDEDLQAHHSARHPGSVSKARLRLERLELVVDSGRTRLSRFRVKQRVFEVTKKGIELHEELNRPTGE